MVLKNIALTGSSGMLGRHFIEIMVEKKISAQLTSRTSPKLLPNNVAWKFWDLVDWKTPDELDELFDNVDALIHAGAFVVTSQDPKKNQNLFDANVRACVNLSEWALVKDIPVVFISAATVYENPFKKQIVESDPLTTKESIGGFYGYSKLLAEKVFYYFMDKGLKLCILRPSSIYGYGISKKSLVSKWLYIAAQNKIIEISPPIDDTINLIHASDVSQAAMDALEQEAWGIYNIASQNVRIKEIAKTCIDIVGKGKINISLINTSREPSQKYNLSYCKANETFGFYPRFSFNDGLAKMWGELKKDYCHESSMSCM